MVQAALKPVSDFTDKLLGESYVTVSSVKPILQLLTEDLLAPNPSDTELTEKTKRKMCRVQEEKYSAPAIKDLLAKSSLLNPRYRGQGEDDLEALLKEIVAMGETRGQMSGASSAATATGASGGDESGGNGESAQTAPPVKKQNLGDLKKNPCPVPIRVRAVSELTRYLQEEQLDSSADLLTWWRDNCGQFPLMEKVARHYMCICATSCASEWVFSAVGNIVTPLHSCLKPENINMLVFLAWYLDIV